MANPNLEALPKKTLIDLVKMYSRNWQTLDGLWFGNVEAAFGLEAVLTVLSFMSWQLTSPLFECETKSPSKVIIYYAHCAVQDGRAKLNKPLFPCKTMKLTLLSSIARVAEPKAKVKCLSCPPDARHPDYWCKWELSLKQ